MKRTAYTIAILAAIAALTICLAGCSSSSANSTQATQASSTATTAESSSTEEKVAEAEAQDFDGAAYYELKDENPARAKLEYDGKTYKVTGSVESIYSDNITICTDTFNGKAINPFTVKLPTDQIAELSTGDTITAVGKFVYKESPSLCVFEDATIVK